MELSSELIAKAKETKTPEELMAFAKENGNEMTEESAKAYFDLIHPQSGEIADDELDNVSGGGCHADDGREIVTVAHCCTGFSCKKCDCGNERASWGVIVCRRCGRTAYCNRCKYCTYEKGLWLCNKDNHNNKKRMV